MNSYNGFTPQQRSRAGSWIRSQIAKGLRQPPSRCCACGQTEGVLDNHQEDYSEPFGDHLFRFPMCYPCHMMLHCRFKAPESWRAYREQIRAGKRLQEPFMTRAWGRFKDTLLVGSTPALFCDDGIANSRVLDEIHEGLHLPHRGQLELLP